MILELAGRVLFGADDAPAEHEAQRLIDLANGRFQHLIFGLARPPLQRAVRLWADSSIPIGSPHKLGGGGDLIGQRAAAIDRRRWPGPSGRADSGADCPAHRRTAHPARALAIHLSCQSRVRSSPVAFQIRMTRRGRCRSSQAICSTASSRASARLPCRPRCGRSSRPARPASGRDSDRPSSRSGARSAGDFARPPAGPAHRTADRAARVAQRVAAAQLEARAIALDRRLLTARSGRSRPNALRGRLAPPPSLSPVQRLLDGGQLAVATFRGSGPSRWVWTSAAARGLDGVEAQRDQDRGGQDRASSTASRRRRCCWTRGSTSENRG
jgi:hypothetical protein